MTDRGALKAVSLTHVRYVDGDILGQILGWASLLPVFIALGGFVTHILFRRELQSLFFGLGLGVSECTNQIMKAVVKEPRPPSCKALEMCDSQGWPSSHSQFMCLFSIYLSLLCIRKLHFADKFSKAFTIFIPWPFVPTVMYSRVYLGYHTTGQVFAGGSLGLLLGTFWYFLINKIVAPSFPALENTALCRYFRIKDSTHIPDVIGFEYKNSRAARQEASRSAEPARPKPRSKARPSHKSRRD